MFLKSYKKIIIIGESYSQTIGRRQSLEFTRSDHEGDDQSRLKYPSWVYNNNHKVKGPSLVTEEKVTMRMGRLSSNLDMQNGDSTWHMESKCVCCSK